ncbi:hypothetical protein F4679DRAFT_579947 [Xylaria curta]|nr:hypothetical protein F4679DRAFT_579947 [Xylaria curta]
MAFADRFSYRAPNYCIWYWMSYQGGIDYVDPPFDQTVWETDDIHPPQIKSNALKAPSADPLHSDSMMELFATAREFNVAGHVKLVYETEDHKSDGMRRQCVVVAKSKEGLTIQEKEYYALLVSPLSPAMDNSDNIYELVGAGMMLGRFINFIKDICVISLNILFDTNSSTEMSTSKAEVPNPGAQSEEPDKETKNYEEHTQEFSAKNINTVKLMTFLTARFGLGGYDVWMMRNRFFIKAPGQLSIDQIEQCRSW